MARFRSPCSNALHTGVTGTAATVTSVLVACALAFLAAGRASAVETLVTNQEEYRDAVERAQPGDVIVLANGVWRNFEILLVGNGEPERPITLTAETRGQVVISGQSNLRLAGSHLVVSGLVFRDGYTPTSAVISFRRTKGEPANYSRVTETVIDRFNNPERHEIDFWVLMFGRHNRFDHNHVEGKGNLGSDHGRAAGRRGKPAKPPPHRPQLLRPASDTGNSNGGETLRIGTSHHSLSDSLTVVENNVFDRCNGELEIISNKSGGNVFRGNLFLESRGTLTMRHGNNAVVEDNVFLGNGVSEYRRDTGHQQGACGPQQLSAWAYRLPVRGCLHGHERRSGFAAQPLSPGRGRAGGAQLDHRVRLHRNGRGAAMRSARRRRSTVRSVPTWCSTEMGRTSSACMTTSAALPLRAMRRTRSRIYP